jgi:hypothetical protein
MSVLWCERHTDPQNCCPLGPCEDYCKIEHPELDKEQHDAAAVGAILLAGVLIVACTGLLWVLLYPARSIGCGWLSWVIVPLPSVAALVWWWMVGK